MKSVVSAAQARIRLSELLGRVAYAQAEFVITRKGKPVARLVPLESAATPASRPTEQGLSDADPFFAALAEIRSRPARARAGRRRR